MTMESEAGFISLLELANTVTDEISTLLTRNPAAGIYTVVGELVEGSQKDAIEDKPPLIQFKFVAEVLDCKPIDKKVDPQTLVGRKLNEVYTLWPADMEQLLGLLKGRYQKVGLSNKGNLGGVPNAAPGWLDGMVGHIFQMRVSTFMQNGQERVRYDWVGPAPTPAA